MKYSKKIFLPMLVILCFILLTSCTSPNTEDEKVKFDKYIKELFIKEVQTDSITLNYMLSDPSAYDITSFEPKLGDLSLDYLQKSLNESKEIIKSLKSFNYSSLTDEQKFTYDILLSYLETELSSEDLLLFVEVLSPTIGIQAQLPVLLAEYNFHTKNDIDNYLKLLPLVYDYYKSIIDFEKLKSQNGLFMADFAVDDIVKQCSSFIEDPTNNFLIDVVNDKIDGFPSLTNEERNKYKSDNKDAVLNYIIPAYELLIDELISLKGTGKNEGGLANYDKGKKYYEYLIESSTGSSKTIEEINKLLESNILKNSFRITSIITKNPDLYDELTSPSYIATDPDNIIEVLKSSINDDFPEPPTVNHTVKYVHESLQSNLSPAFYLIPPIDKYNDNVIYINQNPDYDQSQLFTTLAHEGYPGHLYQTVYFHSQNPEPIRQIMNFGGYTEGWATYVELSSFYWGCIDENVAELLEKNLAIILCLYSRIDTGINYDGWDLDKTNDYLKGYGFEDPEVGEQIYKTMIEEPGNYLKYCLGYLEFIELKEKAMNKLGDKFVLKDFNEFLLKTGPAQFKLIDKQLDKWIADR